VTTKTEHKILARYLVNYQKPNPILVEIFDDKKSSDDWWRARIDGKVIVTRDRRSIPSNIGKTGFKCSECGDVDILGPDHPQQHREEYITSSGKFEAFKVVGSTEKGQCPHATAAWNAYDHVLSEDMFVQLCLKCDTYIEFDTEYGPAYCDEHS
jgi:predicted RNA-binding Zn-ribbon protein involved in translation (DUF1610 family)